MSRKTRRAVIGLTGAALVAGCTGSDNGGSGDQQNQVGGGDGSNEDTPTDRPDSDSDGVPDSQDDFPDDSSLSQEIASIDDMRQLQEDEWYVWELEFSEETTIGYQFTVREGPPIDVIMFTQEEYQHYKQQKRARYVSDASVWDSAGGEAEATLPAGNYRFVLDHTNWGEAVPPTNMDDDVVEVSVKFLAAR